MKKVKVLLLLIISISLILININMSYAATYENEVYYSNGYYHWRTFNVERGSTTDLATAIQGAISTGDRTVHITCGGNLNSQINLQPGLTLQCHGNTFTKTHSGCYCQVKTVKNRI
jgi:hypothetical protein